MPFAANIFYKSHPTSATATRPPVILIHGAGGSHLSWPPTIRHMAGHTVYALDLPGHGASTDCQIESIEDYCHSVKEWKESLNIPSVILVGHSMGSAIALQWALDAPDTIAALVLLGSSARLKVNPALLTSLSNPETYSQAVERIIRWSFSEEVPDNLKILVGKRMLESDPDVLRRDFSICDKFDITPRLSEIEQPALVSCGELDKMTPLRESISLAEGLPSAQLKTIPGAGHMVMLEKPAETLALLQQFLEQAGVDTLS